MSNFYLVRQPVHPSGAVVVGPSFISRAGSFHMFNHVLLEKYSYNIVTRLAGYSQNSAYQEELISFKEKCKMVAKEDLSLLPLRVNDEDTAALVHDRLRDGY